ncbi:glycoside hydrolase family 3 N-terminal domain-containing protein [Kutzneria viridogrisea]|uniref:Beta-N-acetylhexosaminidase n=1 Tax=Kutzneria viridogrisea TaxID=47990 RepID=A0ABR6BJG0_9PSEU|nr:beta-N-acetylhexosaminidase [Kutzneria viridogrisea]
MPIEQRSRELLRLADAVLQPGFEGTSPPDWVRRRLDEGLGGVVLFSRNISSPAQVGELTAALRECRPDVLVAIDEEAGDVTRMEAHTGSSRPGNLALGVVDDVALTEELARDLGHDLAAAGVNLDYAPSGDVNSNPDNPVIGVRSFGACPDLVARHTAAWIRGLQSAGVAACVKHFPGHGDTSVDSHLALPVLAASMEELAEIALPPFRAAVRAGVCAVMGGHLMVPAYDTAHPATLSRRILVELLREELGFDGLIVTDAIEMRAVSDRYGLAEAAVLAVAAGSDAVCVGGDLADEATATRLRDALADAVATGRLPEQRLVEAATRVRALADWVGTAVGSARDQGTNPAIGLTAARRAIRVTVGPGQTALPLSSAPHVVEFHPEMNQAIDRRTPWGLAAPLTELLAGTTAARLTPAEAADAGRLTEVALTPAAGRPLVLVVRDAHRHEWMASALNRITAARPDAGIVEMGLPHHNEDAKPGSFHLATHGATRVSGQAAAEVLAGYRN